MFNLSEVVAVHTFAVNNLVEPFRRARYNLPPTDTRTPTDADGSRGDQRDPGLPRPDPARRPLGVADG